MPSQIALFCAWVAEVGGTGKAAALIGCTPAYVSNMKKRRKPGRKYAARIQALGGPPATGWDE